MKINLEVVLSLASCHRARSASGIMAKAISEGLLIFVDDSVQQRTELRFRVIAKASKIKFSVVSIKLYTYFIKTEEDEELPVCAKKTLMDSI